MRCIKGVRPRSHSQAIIHWYQWLASSLVLLSFRTETTGSFIQLCFKILNYQRWCSSRLYPWTFLIFINEIVNDIKANIRLFADDTSLYIIVEDPVASAAVLNHDLSQISSWSKKWLVTFNPSKTESVIFSRKHQKQHHPSLYLDNVPISQVSTHTRLGVTFTPDGKWQPHISSNINKAWH